MRPKENVPALRPVEIAPLPTTAAAAFLRLLDDPAPTVRRALLAQFKSRGPAATAFLHTIAHGPDAALARHAAQFLQGLDRGDPVAEFSHFIRSRKYELELGAFLMARIATPRLDPSKTCTALDAIATRCRELIVEPASTREKCRILNRVLFHEWAFHGNTENYTDPKNNFIDQVLARRTGVPLTLCLLYLLVSARLGLPLQPVGLPGHFIVGCFDEEPPFFIDAFSRGVFLDREEISALMKDNRITLQPTDLTPTTVREVLCRSCRNLVNHYTIGGDPARAQIFSRFVDEFHATYARPSVG